MCLMTKPFGGQALCRAQKYVAVGSSKAAGNATALWLRCSEEFLHLFHCSEEPFPAESICLVFSKYDLPTWDKWMVAKAQSL